MPFTEGHQKRGGRIKGTPNRLTKEYRMLLKNILYSELEKIPEYQNPLQPKEKLEVIIKLLNYVIPKVNPINSSSDEPFDFKW